MSITEGRSPHSAVDDAIVHAPTRVLSIAAGSSSSALFLVRAFWILMTFEVDWFLTGILGAPFYRVPTLLLPVLAFMIVSRGNRRAIYWPLLIWVSLHAAAAVLAENAGYSRDAFKFMLYMLVLFAASVSYLDSPSTLITVLKLYLLSFVWFGVQGLPKGLVWWHPLLANEDSYGPMMVIGMALSYFFALATASALWRWIARTLFLVSLLGVVVSFARGAAVAAAVVLTHIVLRSPQRTKTLGALIVGALLLMPVAALIVPMDAYIEELRSTAEGDDARTTLWQLAWNVFKTSPLYGVGASNFGVVASKISAFDWTRAVAPDPAQLYRFAVHNAYMQILAEEGLIGIALWGGMIAAFVRWNAALRTERARVLWNSGGGSELDLPMIARGLEGAMLGYLCTALFYNQIYIHWFWSLLILCYALTRVTEGATQVAGNATGAIPDPAGDP